MKPLSLSRGLVLLTIALAGTQPVPTAAQSISPAPEPAEPAVAASPPETPPVAAAPAPAVQDDAKSTKTEPAKAEPDRPTRTAALPEVTKPATIASARTSAQTERHIARLHAALKITPAQEPQWDAFAQVMRENAAHMESLAKSRPTTAVKMSAVDGLKSYEQVTQAHLEDLQKLEPAFAALYGTLSDSQKKSADAMFSQAAVTRKPRPAKPTVPTSSEE